jgi:beta-N-acetylhexosaminidase
MLCNQSIGDGAPLDELLDGFGAAAQAGRWRPKAAGEARRRALLPPSPALAWDALVGSPAYGRALSQLPA